MFLIIIVLLIFCVFFFFFNDTATTEIYTLSLHDALPIFHSAPDRCKPPHRQTGHGVKDRKSTRLNSSHVEISYAVFCLKKKKKKHELVRKIHKNKKHQTNIHLQCIP